MVVQNKSQATWELIHVINRPDTYSMCHRNGKNKVKETCHISGKNKVKDTLKALMFFDMQKYIFSEGSFNTLYIEIKQKS